MIGKNTAVESLGPQPEHKTYLRKHSNRNLAKKADNPNTEKNDELKKLEELKLEEVKV